MYLETEDEQEQELVGDVAEIAKGHGKCDKIWPVEEIRQYNANLKVD
ncbi:MAG TPA: hypothetical protein VG733_14160 [Chthoniobacteraceae bacterium]|nr:hypothetical protein [Chthoniobacteraceae bacterium]